MKLKSEQSISSPTAALACALGVEVELKHWETEEDGYRCIIYTTREMVEDEKTIPIYNVSQSQLQRWLREKFKIHVIINCLDEFCWSYHIPNIGGEKDFKTYEEALEYALQEGLKLIKA